MILILNQFILFIVVSDYYVLKYFLHGSGVADSLGVVHIFTLMNTI